MERRKEEGEKKGEKKFTASSSLPLRGEQDKEKGKRKTINIVIARELSAFPGNEPSVIPTGVFLGACGEKHEVEESLLFGKKGRKGIPPLRIILRKLRKMLRSE